MERDENKGSGTEQPEVAEADSGHNSAKTSDEPDLIDEYGEPLPEEPHEHVRKRPVYKRPAFLIGAVVVLLIVAIVGLRSRLYRRPHQSTHPAFIPAHILHLITHTPRIIPN